VHNGNLINAHTLRADLEQDGAIFQSTSDTEVILHLIARSQTGDLVTALGEAASRIQGAYSLLLLTEDTLVGVRDANGFRPLNLGKLNRSEEHTSELQSRSDLVCRLL